LLLENPDARAKELFSAEGYQVENRAWWSRTS
jgi:hypothetical protein